MTKQLLLGVLAALLTATALAQDARPPTPPKYCNPCLFYGGDFSNSSDAAGLANEEDVLVSKAEVLGPFVVPKTQQWEAIGLFTNDLSSVDLIDPAQAAWSIASGVHAGKCGPALASGKGHATFKPTGRSAFGENEFTTLVKIKAVHLKSGKYWLTTVPVCTNSSSCGSARYFATSFEGKPLDPFGPPEPCNLSFADSKVFQSKCMPVFQNKGCGRFSAGVLGTK